MPTSVVPSDLLAGDVELCERLAPHDALPRVSSAAHRGRRAAARRPQACCGPQPPDSSLGGPELQGRLGALVRGSGPRHYVVGPRGYVALSLPARHAHPPPPDCSAQIRDLYDGLFLSNQLGKTPDSGSGMPSTGSAGTTPTPISPSPGVVQAVSPIMAAAAAPRREKEPKEGAPQAVVSQPSGSVARPGGEDVTDH